MKFRRKHGGMLWADVTHCIGHKEADTTFDIEMGNRAGCKTVAVTYGNHTKEKLQSANPTWMIDTFEELKEI